MLFLLERNCTPLLIRQRRIDTCEELPLIFPEIENFETAIGLSGLLKLALNPN